MNTSKGITYCEIDLEIMDKFEWFLSNSWFNLLICQAFPWTFQQITLIFRLQFTHTLYTIEYLQYVVFSYNMYDI